MTQMFKYVGEFGGGSWTGGEDRVFSGRYVVLVLSQLTDRSFGCDVGELRVRVFFGFEWKDQEFFVCDRGHSVCAVFSG